MKVHLACDGHGRPLGVVLSGGNTNDCTRLEQVMDSISVPRVGPGRPRTRPTMWSPTRATTLEDVSWGRIVILCLVAAIVERVPPKRGASTRPAAP